MNDHKDKLIKKYCKLIDHLDSVDHKCRTLAIELIRKTDHYELAHEIVIFGKIHDLSKFYGDEWKYLCDYDGDKTQSTPELMAAIEDHVRNNYHHPEAWDGGIHEMDEASLAVLLCDWVARGEEFDNPIGEFMQEKAFKKYGFNRDSQVFKKLDYFHRLLTGEPIWCDEWEVFGKEIDTDEHQTV